MNDSNTANLEIRSVSSIIVLIIDSYPKKQFGSTTAAVMEPSPLAFLCVLTFDLFELRSNETRLERVAHNTAQNQPNQKHKKKKT